MTPEVTPVEQYHQLKVAIDWLYMQPADLFLCGEIIEVQEAKKLLADPDRIDANLPIVWRHITQNIMPAVEIRLERGKVSGE